MKTIKYTISVCIIALTLNTYGQTPKTNEYRPFSQFNGDTLQYLLQNFLYRFPVYRGQPLSVLFNDLELDIKNHLTQTTWNSIKYTYGIYLFWYPEDSDVGEFRNNLHIDLIDPFIEDSLRLIDNRAGYVWTTTHANFIKNCRIKEILVGDHTMVYVNNSYYRSLCNPASPNYNATICEQQKCESISVNYNADSCYKSRCNPASVNYNAVICAGLCDPASPYYSADFCAASRCTPTSPNYDASKCAQACNLKSPYYNCVSCQKQRTTPGTTLYKQEAAYMMSQLSLGRTHYAAENYFYTMFGSQLYGISYAVQYNPNQPEVVKITGNPGGTINIVIGAGFNSSTYYGTLCQELYRAKETAINLYNGEYSYYPDYGDFLTYAYTLADCMGSTNYPEASPSVINGYYAKLVTAYNNIPETLRHYVFNYVTDYIQGQCHDNLAVPASCE
jgi:hypothetical protein